MIKKKRVSKHFFQFGAVIDNPRTRISDHHTSSNKSDINFGSVELVCVHNMWFKMCPNVSTICDLKYVQMCSQYEIKMCPKVSTICDLKCVQMCHNMKLRCVHNMWFKMCPQYVMKL